jgi:hypothetical protein
MVIVFISVGAAINFADLSTMSSQKSEEGFVDVMVTTRTGSALIISKVPQVEYDQQLQLLSFYAQGLAFNSGHK